MSEEIGEAVSTEGCRPETAPVPAITASPAWTAGPWYWDAGIVPPDGPERYATIYIDGGDTVIAEFNNLIPEGRSNATLIAAAPDLYEALEWLLDEWDALGCGDDNGAPVPDQSPVAINARAALNAARYHD